MTQYEKKNNPALGDLVTVDGKQMSVYVKGEGENTIVLLPGLGRAAPILDFMPLTERLAEHNRVVVVEPFGYGWSDVTNKERTVENTVEELRSALQAEGIQGPYVLMPHSISGLDAIYYANTYPNEVKAVIGIDCTLPSMDEYFGEELPEKMPLALGTLSQMGIMRWLNLIAPDNFVSDNTCKLYSEENLAMQRCIASWKGQNRDVIDQLNHIASNEKATEGMSFPKNLPLLFFTQDGTYQTPRSDGKDSVSFFNTYVTNEACQKVVALKGQHYLHWSCAEKMAEETTKFLQF